MTRAAALLALAVATAVPGPSRAQVCAGAPPFRPFPVRVETTAAVGDSVTLVGGSVSVGSERVFGTAGVGAVAYDPFPGWSLAASLGSGYQLPVDAGSHLQICPTAEFSLVVGPDSLYSGYGSNVRHRATALSLGVSVGARLGSPAMSVAVSAGVAAVRTNRRNEDVYAFVERERSTTGLFRLAVSVSVGDRLTLRPWIGMPFGQSRYSSRIKIRDASTRIGIAVGMGLGRPRRASAGGRPPARADTGLGAVVARVAEGSRHPVGRRRVAESDPAPARRV